ncbi:MAG TPA: aminoglycoside adenylyltransferase domain-containing protein [Chloroflexia bacterium]|nr:aminoglycoside adenylyltransferase domain-containing protein [Chloroflexia bacterium]
MLAMVPDPAPYPDVNATLAQLLDRLDGLLGPRVLGMYLYGSLTMGDWTPERSDIDVVVVTDSALSSDVVAGLHALHADLTAHAVPWGIQLEVSYIPAAQMRRHDPGAPPYPTIERGESVRVGAHRNGGAIQRYQLYEHGIVVAGPPVRTWVDPVTPDDLRRDVRAIAAEWLVPLSADPFGMLHPGYQAYVIPTLCRMLYTLEHGTVVSKPVAARWAMEALDPRWRPLIAWAMGDDLQEARAMVADVLARVGVSAPPAE